MARSYHLRWHTKSVRSRERWKDIQSDHRKVHMLSERRRARERGRRR